MSPITLKANESKILVAAASNGGLVAFPTRLKDVTRQRMAGLFAQHGLAEAVDDALQLTRAGYHAVGLRHRARRAFRCAMSCVTSCSASLTELVDATGWLPHTTRAALSCLRSSGHALAKSKRDDSVTCYRLLVAAAPVRTARQQHTEAAAEMAA